MATSYQEKDYLRDIDLLDFGPCEEKFFQPQPQHYPTMYSQQNYHQAQQQSQFLPAHRTNYGFPQVQTYSRFPQQMPKQNLNDDLFSALNLDLEDRELLGSLEPLAPAVDLRRMRNQGNLSCSSDTLDIFEFNSSGKRELSTRGDQVSNKKRKLPTGYSSTSYEIDSSEESSSFKYKTKQKRTKWLRNEVQSLWEGIALYGNNWRLIKKKAFGHRTYYQVKDKGRRILSSQGWSSGRTKATHDGAAEEAKLIAEKVLMSSAVTGTPSSVKSEIKSEQGSVVAGSTGSPISESEIDFDIDFDCSSP